MKLAFVRHGQYEQITEAPSALQPYPLTSEGREAARVEALRFADWLEQNSLLPEPVIYASTLLRAWETASIYAEALSANLAALRDKSISVVSDSALCERSVGAVANLTAKEIERILELDPRFKSPPRGWKSQSDYRLPFDGAESLIEAGQRVAEFVRQHRATSEKTIQIFVGHGASIRHAACHLNVIEQCDINRLSMFYAHPVALRFDANNGWDLIYGGWKQRRLEDPPD